MEFEEIQQICENEQFGWIDGISEIIIQCKCQYIFVQKVENKNVQKSSFKLSLKYLLNTVA